MKSLLFSLLLLLCVVQGQADPVMIRLVDPLDEPEFYCVDVPGFRQNVQLKAPLMAHTLKRFGSADEMWVIDYPSKGQIFANEYGLCIEAASATAGASLFLKKPSNSPLQRFEFTGAGALVLANHPELGFAIEAGKGTKAGGPSHLKRGLSLKTLSKSDNALTTWKVVTSEANWPE